VDDDDSDVINSLDQDSDLVVELADALREAERARAPIAQPSAAHPDLDIATAYRVQRRNLQRRLSLGENIIGHKIGLTSLAMQRQLGVDQPDYGAILDTMVVPNRGTLCTELLISPRIEAEFAFSIGADLPLSPTREELIRSIDGVAVSLEIIDSRVADWTIGLVDTIADNASSARIVYGEFVPPTSGLLASLPDTVISLAHNGNELGSGPGSAVLGDPLTSLLWLAQAIGAHGDHFFKGQIILAGAVSAALALTPDSRWTATADGFPTATLRTVEKD